jgi:GntR family carbon starvation induced transcriptional regulator
MAKRKAKVIAIETQSGTPRSLVDRVYRRLRAEILAGHLGAGQKLKISELCSTYGVSLNVVREALNRLTGERLVQSDPQIGFAVSTISPQDLVDLINVRISIECLALRSAIEKGNVEWESRILAAHHRLAHTPIISDDPTSFSAEWIRVHSEFHSILVEGCSSPRLLEIVRRLSETALIYQRNLLPLAALGRDLAAEHLGLAEAVLKRDADLAVERLTAHYERTRKDILVLLEEKTSLLEAS